MCEKLSTHDHDRDASGMLYVYPVVSRRAGGISVGINLNPNNACNWHCAYCQVPDLRRGSAPDIDRVQLSEELKRMLDDIQRGSFMRDRVPTNARRLCDIAISGNGEPTSCGHFELVVKVIADVMQSHKLEIPLRLITNGSYMGKARVQDGLRLLAAHHGEVWIKVDAATDAGIGRINGVSLAAQRLAEHVTIAAHLCPSWIQTCMMAWDGKPPEAIETEAYIQFVRQLKTDAVPLRGILLYGLARPSMQPEAVHISALDAEWMQQMAARVEAEGWDVKLSL